MLFRSLEKPNFATEPLELCLGIRIVIADMRAAMGLGDIQVDQQGRHRLRSHAGAAIRVQGEGTPGAMCCLATLSAISFSASSALSRGAIIQPTT